MIIFILWSQANNTASQGRRSPLPGAWVEPLGWVKGSAGRGEGWGLPRVGRATPPLPLRQLGLGCGCEPAPTERAG